MQENTTALTDANGVKVGDKLIVLDASGAGVAIVGDTVTVTGVVLGDGDLIQVQGSEGRKFGMYAFRFGKAPEPATPVEPPVFEVGQVVRLTKDRGAYEKGELVKIVGDLDYDGEYTITKVDGEYDAWWARPDQIEHVEPPLTKGDTVLVTQNVAGFAKGDLVEVVEVHASGSIAAKSEGVERPRVLWATEFTRELPKPPVVGDVLTRDQLDALPEYATVAFIDQNRLPRTNYRGGWRRPGSNLNQTTTTREHASKGSLRLVHLPEA